MSTGLAHKAENLAEPKPAALTDFFGCEKRIEGLRHNCWGHAFAAVSDGEEDVLSFRNVVFAGNPSIDQGVGGVDRQLAALSHCVPRIDREVQNCALKLDRIGKTTPQTRRKHGLDLNVLTERSRQQLSH